MSKKNSKTANGGGTVNIPITDYTYIGANVHTNNAINQLPPLATTSTATISGFGGYNVYKDDTLPVYYNLYEEDGNLFYKNSKGEVFKLTFTKQETVKQIIQDL